MGAIWKLLQLTAERRWGCKWEATGCRIATGKTPKFVISAHFFWLAPTTSIYIISVEIITITHRLSPLIHRMNAISSFLVEFPSWYDLSVDFDRCVAGISNMLRILMANVRETLAFLSLSGTQRETWSICLTLLWSQFNRFDFIALQMCVQNKHSQSKCEKKLEVDRDTITWEKRRSESQEREGERKSTECSQFIYHSDVTSDVILKCDNSPFARHAVSIIFRHSFIISNEFAAREKTLNAFDGFGCLFNYIMIINFIMANNNNQHCSIVYESENIH